MKYVIFGLLVVALLLGTFPISQAQEIELGVPPLYLNPSQCLFSEITISNADSQDIFNVKIKDQINIPNCCSMTSSKRIDVLESGTSDTIPIRLCSPPSTNPGDYIQNIRVSHLQGGGNVPFYIHVTMDFEGVLKEKINQIETAVSNIVRTRANTNHIGFLIGIRSYIQEAESSIAAGDLESAGASVEKSENILEQLEGVEDGIPLGPLVASIMIVAFVIILILLVFYREFNATTDSGYAEYRYGSSDGMEVSKGEDLLKKLEMLQTKLLVINTKNFSRIEKYYHQSAVKDLEKIKQFIIDGSMDAARKTFNNAEMNLGVLEHRLASLKLFKEVKKLFESIE